MKYIKRLLMLLIVIVLVIGGYYVYLGYQMYDKAKEEKPFDEMVETIKSNQSYTSLDQLPSIYLDAVIAVEDHRFYEHGGIDVLAIGRAIGNDIISLSFKEGGSTITQQLAKNLYFTQEKKIERKIAEVFMAFDIEKTCSKDEILELYLNTIYFGDGYYCVKDASLGYFDKLPSEMNEYEATLLAGIPNAPSAYSPTNSTVLASQRQRQVLERMVKCNYLDQEEADKIAALGSVEQIDRID
ncbi:MAG: transglycosylase domain-containing protein [Beduini sp.]|uniref:transglycosylase domain-containing protein n=1 Tax=Beduini sp. TaxID=1922300 RepID=UPI0011C838B9